MKQPLIASHLKCDLFFLNKISDRGTHQTSHTAKKDLIVLCFILTFTFLTVRCFGQDDLAATEIYSDGILLPRLQINAVDNPVEGYLIYDINAGGIMYYDGSDWLQIGNVFIKDGNVVRQASGFNQDFIFGRERLPIDGEILSDTFFFFDYARGAFRGGGLDADDSWSPSKTGKNSFAYGHNTTAFGEAAVALGNNTTAQGKESFAMGHNSIAHGFGSVAIGNQCESSGTNSIAIGDQTKTEDAASVALGVGTIASGFVSTALGNFTRARGNSSIATGHITESIGFGSTAMGFDTKALGFASTSMGNGTQINSSSGLAIGLFNDTIRSATGGASFSDPLFIVGNGVDHNNLSNAMVVRNNGTVGIGTNGGDAKLDVRGLGASNEPHLLLVDENPAASFPRVYARLSDTESLAANHYWEFNSLAKPSNDHQNAKWNFFYAGSGKNILQLQGDGNVFLDGNIAVTSGRRLKSNIQSISNRASGLLQLGGYTYNRKSSEASEIGLIAQEVEEYFPELVIENDEGYKTVNYDGLIPVLIEIIKNQEERIEKLEK